MTVSKEHIKAMLIVHVYAEPTANVVCTIEGLDEAADAIMALYAAPPQCSAGTAEVIAWQFRASAVGGGWQPWTDCSEAWFNKIKSGLKTGWRKASDWEVRVIGVINEPQEAPKMQRYVAELKLDGRYTWCIVEAIPRVEKVIQEFGFGPDAQKAADDTLALTRPKRD